MGEGKNGEPFRLVREGDPSDDQELQRSTGAAYIPDSRGTQQASTQQQGKNVAILFSHWNADARMRAFQVLQVQISDELDPFFLYSLELDDEDFKSLKVDQCILVDFSVFPHKFIELLEHCLDAKSEDHGRFLAVLNVRTGDSTLNVVETNQFKHVNHISLCFRQGNDATVKSYLAARLGDYKVNLDLHQKLQKTLESLENSIKEADKLKEYLFARSVRKCMQECLAMKEKLERDRADMECRLRLRADAQESHVSQLDKQVSIECLIQTGMQECSSLRKKNVGYDNKLQDYSKQINQHLIRLASLEQEVAALEMALRDAQAAHERLEEKASASIAEANRYSQAVERLQLQGELRASKAKVKLKAQVTSQQETLLQERQVTIEKNTADSNFMRQEIASLKSDNDCLRKKVTVLDSRDESKEKLEEMQEMAKSNQQMIQYVRWLNQQLTDSQLAKL
ncbi:spindle assembly protein, partial [Selaginella moellendorffii]